jgi:hypothetical protein
MCGSDSRASLVERHGRGWIEADLVCPRVTLRPRKGEPYRLASILRRHTHMVRWEVKMPVQRARAKPKVVDSAWP